MFNLKRGQNKVSNDLDITPFLSLMVVLIPILLVCAKFSLLADYNLQVNKSSDVTSPDVMSEKHDYKLIINEDNISLADGIKVINSSSLNNTDIKNLLSKFFEGKRSVSLTIEVSSIHNYQFVVDVVDCVHSYDEKLKSVSVDVKGG